MVTRGARRDGTSLAGGAKTHRCSSPHDGQPHAAKSCTMLLLPGAPVSRSVAAPGSAPISMSSARQLSDLKPPGGSGSARSVGVRDIVSTGDPLGHDHAPSVDDQLSGLGRLQCGKVGEDPVEAQVRW